MGKCLKLGSYLLSFLGTLSMLDCNIFPGLGQDYLATEVNMFVLPVQENDSDDSLTKAGWDHIS